jgi:hypothetical protein
MKLIVSILSYFFAIVKQNYLAPEKRIRKDGWQMLQVDSVKQKE